MNMMYKLLKKAVEINMIRPIDFYFSKLIAKKNTILMFIAVCVSYENKNGHVFLPIEYFEKSYFFPNINIKIKKKIFTALGKKINWLQELLNHDSVGDGSDTTPLVLVQKKIYLYKMWKAKVKILHVLQKNKKNKINHQKCSKILNNLFPENNKNIQKIAVALTLIYNITFIIGGPGTGKTTTILKIIIALIKSSKKLIKIQLSAPTGKATTRLTEVIKNNIFNIYLTEKEKKCLPSHAVTIHQLLGIQKISGKSFFHKNNLLDIDVLIIDETSMVDILMIEKILHVVSKTTKIIFIGDHNQLPPIEPGSILKNIALYSNNGYSCDTLFFLKKITKYEFSKKNYKEKNNFVKDNICVLKKNYRFKKSSGIYILSNAICNRKIKVIEKIFTNSIKNVFFSEVKSIEHYKDMIKNISLNYQVFWEKIYKQEKIQDVIKTFQSYQVLCILRDGLFGINTLNKKLEEEMHKQKMIKYFYVNNQVWYIGKPIMITSNNKYLDVFNGNIGITNINHQGILQVSFLKEKDKIKNIPISILKNYETAWVITVHKAQGSEFIKTSLILPDSDSPILNKDILYTGTTRSRKKIDIFSNKEIFIKTILKHTEKNNFLN